MKTENILVLVLIGYVLWKSKQPQQPTVPAWQGPIQQGTGDGLTWISCSEPGADPIMCQWLQQNQVPVVYY